MRSVVFVRDRVNKHSVRALIAAFEKWFPERDYKVLSPCDVFSSADKSSLVLISFATGAAPFYRDFAGKLRLLRPDINTICGGPHPSARAQEALSLFHAVCLGEGEISIKDIIERADDSSVSGLINGVRVENLDDFRVFPRKMISLGPIEIIRGCPSRCAYCQTPQLFPGKLRMRSPEMVAEEIKFALSRKGFADVRFIAPDASSYYYEKGINIAAIERLLTTVRGVLRDNGKLFFGTFPSELDPAGVTKELCDLLVRYCDNRLIVLGLQSASERMQKTMTRRSGLSDTERAISLLTGKGFEIIIDLIFGLPYEDEESYDETYRFIERWRDRVTIHAHPFDPLPGSLWENETPTTVPKRLIRLVQSLEGIGRVFGRTEKRDAAPHCVCNPG